MVTRRFKKGSVYDTLASTSGLDFSPVVHLKTCSSLKDDSVPETQIVKPSDKHWENVAKTAASNTSSSDIIGIARKSEPSLSPQHVVPSSSLQEQKCASPLGDNSPSAKCIATHEKYPSWPVTTPTPSVSYRSHSWTDHTDYPKESVTYTRPKKANQFKILTNQLQPVLERTTEHNSSIKSASENISSSEVSSSNEKYGLQHNECSATAATCNNKQFDFEAFHTPCIPQCFEDKDFQIHSPPEHDVQHSPSSSTTTPTNDFSRFHSQYEPVVHNQAQYSASLSSAPSWRKSPNVDSRSTSASLDTPFLDRLRMDSTWQMPPPPVPMIPEAVAPQQQPQPPLLQPPGHDFELSSENGTWLGSMESSSHGRGVLKWQGSYSDLSTLSTQLSNRSSLFDSGHSTMPESGRLSPQSSCDSTAPSLLLEGPTRAQVVARHGCHREIVAHSARVQQPERHGSESILYYAVGTSAQQPSDAPRNLSEDVVGHPVPVEGASYCRRTSLTKGGQPNFSSSQASNVEYKSKKSPSRQNSRKSSNSYSSEDSIPRSRTYGGDDTSGSSSDISNITCISNYKENIKSKSLDDTLSTCDLYASKKDTETFNRTKYQIWNKSSKAKWLESDSKKYLYVGHDKRQRISDPELKAIQKQAVMSFYQRMSLAESDKKAHTHSVASDFDAVKLTKKCKENSAAFPLSDTNLNKDWETNISNTQCSQPPKKLSDSTLLNQHSKSVPNLVSLKGLPSSQSVLKHTYGSPSINTEKTPPKLPQRRYPLPNDEIISWDLLPEVLEKKKESSEKASTSVENKDHFEDNSAGASMHYFKSHKSPRKVQLKEVRHSNETASVKVMTQDGITLVQTNEKVKPKRRPAPPPPPKEPPKRPPPPPPPLTPPPDVVVVLNGEKMEKNGLEKQLHELRIDVKPISMLSSQIPNAPCCGPSSPELPLPSPPPSQGGEIVANNDDPLPPPPDPSDMNIQPRVLDTSSLIYPKNSYMSYRSEKKYGRYGFNGKYQRSFKTSASSVDLTTFDSSFQNANEFLPSSCEEIHDSRKHGATVVFERDSLSSSSCLHRSNSQDCVSVGEHPHPVDNNISKGSFQLTECNQLSNSINLQSESDCLHLKSVPYHSTSHEKNNIQIQNSFSDAHQNNNSTKVLSNSGSHDDLNSVVAEDSPVLDDVCQKNNSEKTSEINSNIDHNQNAVNCESSIDLNSKVDNGNHMVNQTNSATQTSDKIKLQCYNSKTKEEIECDYLSRKFINHCADVTLKNLLVQPPQHKTMYDYLEGLLELENKDHSTHKFRWTEKSSTNENMPCETPENNCEKSNSQLEFKIVKNQNIEIIDNKNFSDVELNLQKEKEELMQSIGKKVDTLKCLQNSVKEKVLKNELLGQEISNRLGIVARPSEIQKYNLHVEEMEKILSLLLSLSGRLARAENILKNLSSESTLEEKNILESKRDKLRNQHEDAKRLKESIDRRSSQVSAFLRRYLSDDEYADYDNFIRMKTKMLVHIRDLDEKIKLAEEQLSALSVLTHFWKSTNSLD